MHFTIPVIYVYRIESVSCATFARVAHLWSLGQTTFTSRCNVLSFYLSIYLSLMFYQCHNQRVHSTNQNWTAIVASPQDFKPAIKTKTEGRVSTCKTSSKPQQGNGKITHIATVDHLKYSVLCWSKAGIKHMLPSSDPRRFKEYPCTAEQLSTHESASRTSNNRTIEPYKCTQPIYMSGIMETSGGLFLSLYSGV